MNKQIATYIKAGFSCLEIISNEEDRSLEIIRSVSKEMGYSLWSWSCTEGLKSSTGEKVDKTEDPGVALKVCADYETSHGKMKPKPIPEKSIIVLKDFHLFLKSSNPLIIRRMKEAINVGRVTQRHIILLGCSSHTPTELSKEITLITFELPTRVELLDVAKAISKAAGIELNGNTEAVLDAGSGLTTNEFADAASYAFVETGRLDPKSISKIKADTIKKNGILEIVTANVTLDDIGGLALLKADLYSKRNSFTKEAKDYGLPSPRPLLCVGQAGTGKSLTAASAGSVFGVPLLRLEAGRLFGSLVGESEGNWRRAFATAKAIAPAVVWIDEICGLFAGGESSGKTDGGTTSRVIKAILQDLQMNSEGLFFVFTANDIQNLPDPLIDRCDVWSVELPNQEEREAIWKIHIAKRKRKPNKFSTDAFAEKTDGFSGRQIEQVFLKAMNVAFNDGGREPNDKDVMNVLKTFVPTSVTMRDAIEARRERLKGCAKPASAEVNTEASTVRKLA